MSKENNTTTKPLYNTTIPSDWREKGINEIFYFKQGIQCAIEYQFSTCKNGQIRFIRIIDLTGQNEPIRYIDDPGIDHHVKSNDLFMIRYGNPGLLGYGYEGVIANNLFRIIPKVETINGFFYYYLSFKEKQIQKLASSSTMPALNFDSLRQLKLLVPPLPEQRSICQALRLIDSAINQNNQLIAQKELRKKWLMQNLLTGKKRLKGFDGEWKKLGAGEVFRSISIKGFVDEELLSATQDRGIIPRTMLDGRVTMPEGTTAGYKLVEPGDFVISLRSFQGGLEYSYYRGIVSPAYIVLKPKRKINEEFYKQYYKSHEFIGRLATAVIGIRDGKQISYDDYCLVKIPFPSFEEQTAIAQVLQAADKEIQLLKAKTDKLREQKKGMMQVLLTGKKRLKIEI